MIRRSAMLLIAALLSVGCASQDDDPVVASESENVRDDSVAYRPWDAPVELKLGVTTPGSVKYSQCEQVEPSQPETDIEIHCGQAWSEAAWYSINAADVAQELDKGASSLVIDLHLTDPDHQPVARVSIHRVNDDGSRDKLTSRSMVFDGDTVDVPVETAAEHYVYVARGASLLPLWGTGQVDFELAASLR